MNNFMIRFIHLCDAASVDSLRKLSILGIFDRIYLTEVPKKFPKFTVVLDMDIRKYEKKQYIFEITVVGPKDDLPIKPVEIKFNLPDKESLSDRPHMNMILELRDVEFTSYGHHAVSVRVDGQVIGKKEFTVEKPPKKL